MKLTIFLNGRNPLELKVPKAISSRLSAELIQKAKLLAKIHKTNNYQDWSEKIIKERIQLEDELLESIETNLTPR
ncbi:MAG: hypothetical protein ACE5IR_24470 [bacterium]